jgi:hypothetical protein
MRVALPCRCWHACRRTSPSLAPSRASDDESHIRLRRQPRRSVPLRAYVPHASATRTVLTQPTQPRARCQPPSATRLAFASFACPHLRTLGQTVRRKGRFRPISSRMCPRLRTLGQTVRKNGHLGPVWEPHASTNAYTSADCTHSWTHTPELVKEALFSAPASTYH